MSWLGFQMLLQVLTSFAFSWFWHAQTQWLLIESHILHCSFHHTFKNLCPLMLLAFWIKSHQKFKITNVIPIVHNSYGNLLHDCEYLLLLQLFSLGGAIKVLVFFKKINEGATLIGPSPIFLKHWAFLKIEAQRCFPLVHLCRCIDHMLLSIWAPNCANNHFWSVKAFFWHLTFCLSKFLTLWMQVDKLLKRMKLWGKEGRK